MKLDTSRLKNFGIAHGEKIGMGIVGLVFIACIVSAFGHEVYQSTPDELRQLVLQKRDIITQNVPTSSPLTEPYREVPDYEDLVARTGAPIEPHELSTPFYRSNQTIGTKRGTPGVLALTNLRATAKSLAIAVGQTNDQQEANAEVAGAGQAKFSLPIMNLNSSRPGVAVGFKQKAQGAQCAVLVGVVPREEQARVFRNLFKDCAQPNPMFPVYFSFFIERADVTGVNPENAKFERIDSQTSDSLHKHMKNWSGAYREVAHENQIQAMQPLEVRLPPAGVKWWKGLTMPLPPILNQDWGASVVTQRTPVYIEDPSRSSSAGGTETKPDGSEPAIPLPIAPGSAAQPDSAAPAAEEPSNPGPAVPETGSEDPKIPLPTTQSRHNPRLLPVTLVAQRDPFAQDPALPDVPSGQAPRAGARDAAGTSVFLKPEDRIGSETPRTYDAPSTDSDLLFRFFDFTVEPGHEYQYRVKLLLVNPNHQVSPRFLEDPTQADVPYLYTEYSQPSNVVSVSTSSDIIAGPVRPARGANNDRVSLIVSQRDSQTGANVYVLGDFERGQVFNGEFQDVKREEPTDLAIEQVEKFPFDTGRMVLDIRGGERLPVLRDSWGNSSMKEPGRVLVVDGNGRLSVVAESTDPKNPQAFTNVQAAINPEKKDQPTSPDDPAVDPAADPFSKF